jgi:hypothetical protein
MVTKTRGFEPVSTEQWAKDIVDFRPIYTLAEVKLPKRATSHSAGYDIFSPIAFELFPGGRHQDTAWVESKNVRRRILYDCSEIGIGFQILFSIG